MRVDFPLQKFCSKILIPFFQPFDEEGGVSSTHRTPAAVVGPPAGAGGSAVTMGGFGRGDDVVWSSAGGVPKGAKFLMNLPDDLSKLLTPRILKTVELPLCSLKPVPQSLRIRDVDMAAVDAIQTAFCNGFFDVRNTPFGGFYCLDPPIGFIFDGMTRLAALGDYLSGGRIPRDTYVILMGFEISADEVMLMENAACANGTLMLSSSILSYMQNDMSKVPYEEEVLLRFIRKAAAEALGLGDDQFGEYFHRRSSELVQFLREFPSLRSEKMAKDAACSLMIPGQVFNLATTLENMGTTFANYCGKFVFQTIKARVKHHVLPHMIELLESLIGGDIERIGSTDNLVEYIKKTISTRKNEGSDNSRSRLVGARESVSRSPIMDDVACQGNTEIEDESQQATEETMEIDEAIGNTQSTPDNKVDPIKIRIPKKTTVFEEGKVPESIATHPLTAAIFRRRSARDKYWIIVEMPEGLLSFGEHLNVIKESLKNEEDILILVPGFQVAVNFLSHFHLPGLTIGNIYRDLSHISDSGAVTLTQTVLVASKTHSSNWLNIIGTDGFLSYTKNIYELLVNQNGFD